MNRFVTSYINPDLDGFASGLGISHFFKLLGMDSSVVFFGQLDNQTMFLHDRTSDLDANYTIDTPIERGPVVLVDTHHPKLLHSSIVLEDVVLIIDHHSDGESESFPCSSIINQNVGAATTIVYDTFLNNVELPRDLALIMCAAIYSNTLGFTAPSTTRRDRDAFSKLSKVSDWDDKIQTEFDNITKPKSLEVIIQTALQDKKIIEFRSKEVAVLQFESHMGDLNVFDIDNIHYLKNSLKGSVSDFICNIVDLTSKKSLVFSSSDDLLSIISTYNELNAFDDSYIVAPIIQRKTNIMPAFKFE